MITVCQHSANLVIPIDDPHDRFFSHDRFLYSRKELYYFVVAYLIILEKVTRSFRHRILIRPNKNISVFRVTGMTILGRVGTHLFKLFYFWEKYNFMHFERHDAFQNA